MKKLAFVLLMAASISSSFAYKDCKKTKKCKKGKTECCKKTTAHVCTAACTEGKHAYKHGETGHVCTSDCKMK